MNIILIIFYIYILFYIRYKNHVSHVTQLRALLTGEGPTFAKTPPSPLNLKRGSTFPPKSSPPQEWRT